MKPNALFLAIASLFLCALTFASNTPALPGGSEGNSEPVAESWKESAVIPAISANNHIRVEMELEEFCRVKLAVSDFTGRYLFVKTMEMDPGRFEAEIPVKDLSKGTYLLVVTKSGDKEPLERTFVKYR